MSSLRGCKVDPDLAGVRDPATLAALSDAERDEWRAFWAEVDRQIAESADAP